MIPSVMRITHTLIIGSAFCILCTGCSAGPSSANSPTEMFGYLIEDPVPSAVTDLEGVGDTWQGYSIWLRFTATNDYIDSLVSDEFVSIPCDSAAHYFNLPNAYDRFSPSWDPAYDECYEGTVLNAWGDGYHVLGIDRSTGTVHFYGVAA